jgi:phosphatidylserine/phosphatidylglycerophosphate/cardiolipin synthase-like enzyme
MEFLAEQIRRLTADLPKELVVNWAETLQGAGNGDWERTEMALFQETPQPDVRKRLADFIAVWRGAYPHVTGESMGLALLTAVSTASYFRQNQQLELVWTGPDSRVIPLRRTDQALLQLIHEAQESLHIVSFAVYKAENIAQALVDAAERGVAISIYLETPDASEGKMSFDTVKALGDDAAQRARLYVWPKEKRPLTEEGKYGSLHAKIALADGRILLISSANLTGYAMTLNMEMGLLVRGGDAPKQVERHLLRLVEQGVFERI